MTFVRLCVKYGKARQDKNDNKVRRMRFECWMTEATAHAQNM